MLRRCCCHGMIGKWWKGITSSQLLRRRSAVDAMVLDRKNDPSFSREIRCFLSCCIPLGRQRQFVLTEGIHGDMRVWKEQPRAWFQGWIKTEPPEDSALRQTLQVPSKDSISNHRITTRHSRLCYNGAMYRLHWPQQVSVHDRGGVNGCFTQTDFTPS